jgi:hypothetical protein
MQQRLQRLHVVLDAVVQFVEQHSLLRFGLLALADVDKHVDGADDLAARIAQRSRIGNERNASAVGTLGDRFSVADRAPLLQRHGHRALVVAHRRSVGPIELPGHAPLVAADRGRAAGELHRRFIVVGDLPLRVGRVDRGGNGCEQVLQLPLAVAQLRLGLLAFADVARDLRCADDCSLVVAYWRYCQRNVDRAAVLVPANGLVVVDPFAAADARENSRLLVEPIRRDQDGDRFADGLLRFVAEQALGPAIPGPDDAVEILADDGVLGRFHDCGELLAACSARFRSVMSRR